MASYLYRQTTVPTSEKKFTISTWMKISADTSVEKGIIEWYRSANDRYQVLIDTTGKMRIHSQVGGSTGINIYTDMLFRDPASWYNICIHNDTAESSATDRFKLWVNGEAQTFSTYSYTYNGSNINCFDGTSGDAVNVGVRDETSSKFFDGSLADTYYVDGSLIAYTQFGQTDSTSGIWKPNLSPTISSFGNAGFHLKYENSGNLGLDSSGNSLNMTASGTITQNVDTPSNNFATWNPLIPQGLAYANGNLSVTHNASSWKSAYGTLAMSGTGKYYFESKVSALGSYQGIGIVDAEQISASASKFGAESRGYGYKNDASKTNNNSDASYGATYTTGDIIMCAVDLNAGAIWWGKNGAWLNSATQSEIEAGTTTNAGYTSISNSYVYLPAVQIYGSGTNQLNAGSGYFGTTQVASAGTAPSGGGVFEYDCPTNYQSLSTKGINSF